MSHNPFPGPQPYGAAERERFFGREELITRLGFAVLSQRVLTVYGPSGAGKSSLLQAGVVPLLAERWSLRPVVVDAWPPQEITAEGPAGRLMAALEAQLGFQGSADLDAALDLASLRSDRPLLLVLDQIEQLLVHHELPVLRAFVDALHRLECRSEIAMHTVIALREDYLGRWNALLREHPRLTRHAWRVPRLSVVEMVGAVTRSAMVGEPPQLWPVDRIRPLIDQMALEGQWRSDAAEVESAYVQIVCRALWERGGPGVAGELSSALILEGYLQRSLASLGILEAPARHLLETRFITKAGARTPMTRAAGLEEVPSEADLDRILAALEEARILRAQEHRGDRFFELGHDWLASPILLSAQHRRQAQAALQRRRRQAATALILSALLGVATALAWLWLEARAAEQVAKDAQSSALSQRDRAFAAESEARAQAEAASLAQSRALRSAEEATAQREEADRQRVNADSERGNALAALSLAEQERARAEAAVGLEQSARESAQSAARAAADTLAMLAARTLAEDPSAAAPFLRAVAHPEAFPDWPMAAARALSQPLDLAAWQTGRPYSALAFSPSGASLAIGARDGTVELWATAALLEGARSAVAPTPQAVFTLSGAVRRLAFDAAGARLAAATDQGAVAVWSTADHRLLRAAAHSRPVNDLCFAAEGATLGTAADDGLAQLWPLPDGEPRRLEHGGPVWTIDCAPQGGGFLTAAADGGVRRFSAQGDLEATQILDRSALSARFDPAGRSALIAQAGPWAALWRPPAALQALWNQDDFVTFATFSPDGLFIATLSRSGEARLGPLPSPSGLAASHRLGRERVQHLLVLPGGLTVTSPFEGPPTVWITDASGAPLRRLRLHGAGQVAAIAVADGLLATITAEGTGRLWPLDPGQIEAPLRRLGALPRGLAVDGDSLHLSLADGTPLRLSASGAALDPAPSPVAVSAARAASSPDGRYTAQGDAEGQITLSREGSSPLVFSAATDSIAMVALSDHRLAAVTRAGDLWTWPLPSVSALKPRLAALPPRCARPADRRRALGEPLSTAEAAHAACLAEAR